MNKFLVDPSENLNITPFKIHNLGDKAYVSFRNNRQNVSHIEPRFPGDDREKVVHYNAHEEYYKVTNKEHIDLLRKFKKNLEKFWINFKYNGSEKEIVDISIY